MVKTRDILDIFQSRISFIMFWHAFVCPILYFSESNFIASRMASDAFFSLGASAAFLEAKTLYL